MTSALVLDNGIINTVCREAAVLLPQTLGNHLVKATLYGSCARGDYTPDSDVDIAVLVDTNRDATHAMQNLLSEVATKLDLEYFTVINFVCLPYKEFEEKKSWYPYFQNIDREGRTIYERGKYE